MKIYYENKVRLSIQPNRYYDENKNKLLQKLKDMYIQFKKIVRSYVELEQRLNALEDEAEAISLHQMTQETNNLLISEKNSKPPK